MVVHIKEDLTCLFNRCIIPDGQTLMVNDILEFFPEGKKKVYDISAVQPMLAEFTMFHEDLISDQIIMNLYNAFNSFAQTKSIADNLMLNCCFQYFYSKKGDCFFSKDQYAEYTREIKQDPNNNYIAIPLICRRNEDFPFRAEIMAMFKNVMRIINEHKKSLMIAKMTKKMKKNLGIISNSI